MSYPQPYLVTTDPEFEETKMRGLNITLKNMSCNTQASTYIKLVVMPIWRAKLTGDFIQCSFTFVTYI